MRISVIGGATPSEECRQKARSVGRLIAERGHTLVCGGLGGVMAAACDGAKSNGGRTIGILPGSNRAAANDAVDISIATDLGHARNAVVVMNGDAVIAIDGGAGTISELGFAGVFDRPTAMIDPPTAIPGFSTFDEALAAMDHLEEAVQSA